MALGQVKAYQVVKDARLAVILRKHRTGEVQWGFRAIAHVLSHMCSKLHHVPEVKGEPDCPLYTLSHDVPI